MQISERSQQVLKSLVESYIRDGQPVGSRTLATTSGLDLSASTIRNVMADLEELGLIESPHTSAGRVPTDKGYRFFVDSLLTVLPPDSDDIRRLAGQLDPDVSIQHKIAMTSRLLSEISHLAGVVMLPTAIALTLRHIEFVSLSDNRVLVILVIDERDIQNKIIQTQRRFSESELQQAANYLNAQFSGQNLTAVRNRLIHEMQETRQNMDNIMRAAVTMAEQVLDPPNDQGDFIVAGQTNLMGCQELADVSRLRDLFEAFNEKQRILTLLDKSLHSRGIQIFIGEESGCNELNSCSLVTSSYGSADQSLGVLGVIGPTRMSYERVIPLVDITAKLLGAALNQAPEPL